MASAPGRILVVDDNLFNQRLLARALAEQGHACVTAGDGRQALGRLRAEPFDVVLLDVLMPEMDGYDTLAQIKADETLRHIPVIIISAVDEMDSVVRCIELGATDYLPKPFNAALLHARLNASLAAKRLRDLELEYLEQVGHLTEAAATVEAAAYQEDRLDLVAARTDALGQLARVFQRMAREVHAREQRLRRQLEQLRLDIQERQQTAAETPAVYLPMDRRQALARGLTLPNRMQGAALTADVSGFTPLTEALARELGLQRGAEELMRHLNRVYDTLIEVVHRHGGAVVSFSGDAFTGWFDGDDGRSALTCALKMQAAMPAVANLTTPGGAIVPLAIKVGVAVGPARRFLAGAPDIQRLEVLAGRTLDEVTLAEHQAQPGEVLAEAELAGRLAARAVDWRAEPASGRRFAVVQGLAAPAPESPWPELSPGAVPEAHARPWLLPEVYERVRSGQSAFLAELRPAVALFVRFEGLDYDGDDAAEARLDAYVRWVQGVLARQGGSLLQLTIGDKGSYLYAAFGAPVAHDDDVLRALAAAFELRTVPDALRFIRMTGMGLTRGQMRAGAYGGPAQRTYGVIGDRTNLAARLMQAAEGGVLCDAAVYAAAGGQAVFEALPPLKLKGKSEPVAVYRPTGWLESARPRLDHLPPGEQLVLKVASVIGREFELDLLEAIYPAEAERAQVRARVERLVAAGQLESALAGAGRRFQFAEAAVQQAAYGLMLFAQRRQLHRAVAEWIERVHSGHLAPHARRLAHHWQRAEDQPRTLHFLEMAAEQARQAGDYAEARRLLDESLRLEARANLVDEVHGATPPL